MPMPSSRNPATVAISTSGYWVSSVAVSLTTPACASTAYPHTMSRPCATTRLTIYRPPIACQRASWSVPRPRSSGGSRDISATRTTTPYPQSRPRTSPAPVSQPPSPLAPGVLCHHSATTTAPPATMTASRPRGPTRAGRFWGRTGAGLASGRRDEPGRAPVGCLRPGYASAPAWRAGTDRLATLVTRTSPYDGLDFIIPSNDYVVPSCAVQPALVSAS